MSATMDVIVSLCKRRGFIFQSSEIYGGTGSCWDYGPLGVELKNNIKRVWWRDFVQQRDDMVGLDASILMHAMVWKASGHVDHFTDPMVDCRECKHRFRADQVDEIDWTHHCPATKGNKFTIKAGESCKHCGERRTLCPNCGKGELTAPRQFNLMFKTFMGPVEEDAAVTYLRPETAQGIFVNFDNLLQSTRRKLPFGVAQIGKAFRSSASTRPSGCVNASSQPAARSRPSAATAAGLIDVAPVAWAAHASQTTPPSSSAGLANGYARPHSTQRSSRGRWPSTSRQRAPKQMATRGGPAALASARSARVRSPNNAAWGSRSAVSRFTHSTIQAPWPRRSRSVRIAAKGSRTSKWSTRTRSVRPVSKKTSSPSVNSSSAPPKRERIRRDAFATPRTLPWSRE